MKNMWQYAAFGKINPEPVDPQDAADLAPSLNEELLELLEECQKRKDDLESSSRSETEAVWIRIWEPLERIAFVLEAMYQKDLQK